jgi:hypothetical protein
MRFRKLRIVFSITCGIACVLLCVLWMRSYQYCDRSSIVSRVFGCSTEGVLSLAWTDNSSMQQFFMSFVNYPSHRLEPQRGFLGFSTKWHSSLWYVQAPHWFPVTLAPTSAVAPWIRWRFTMRTLLIATTLVAVVLGLIVCLR